MLLLIIASLAHHQNEHICATAIYYYDSKNITSNTLGFRTAVECDTIDFGYEQSDFDGFQKLFGVGGDDPAIQELGEVLAKVRSINL
jgi:hypothetical protein